MIFYYATKKLKQKRTELGVNVGEMADLISADKRFDFKRSYYSHIERGARRVPAELALHIARILKVSVSDIFESKNE